MKTILKLTEKDLHNIVKESVMKILKEGRDWSDEEIEDRIDTEANMDDFPADIKSVKESVDEIGDTPQGQYALGRVGERARRRDDGKTMNMARQAAFKARQNNPNIGKGYESYGASDQYNHQETGQKLPNRNGTLFK